LLMRTSIRPKALTAAWMILCAPSVVATLSKLLSVPATEIATIGDMPNDVLMFRKSGLGIAMGNASPDVQAQADMVTDSYDDEGFAKAIEQFILHREGSSLQGAP